MWLTQIVSLATQDCLKILDVPFSVAAPVRQEATAPQFPQVKERYAWQDPTAPPLAHLKSYLVRLAAIVLLAPLRAYLVRQVTCSNHLVDFS